MLFGTFSCWCTYIVFTRAPLLFKIYCKAWTSSSHQPHQPSRCLMMTKSPATARLPLVLIRTSARKKTIHLGKKNTGHLKIIEIHIELSIHHMTYMFAWWCWRHSQHRFPSYDIKAPGKLVEIPDIKSKERKRRRVRQIKKCKSVAERKAAPCPSHSIQVYRDHSIFKNSLPFAICVSCVYLQV